jgi:hypothetical protein
MPNISGISESWTCCSAERRSLASARLDLVITSAWSKRAITCRSMALTVVLLLASIIREVAMAVRKAILRHSQLSMPDRIQRKRTAVRPQGTAASSARFLTAGSSLVRRLVEARDDPAKRRVRTWLKAVDNERLSGLGLTPQEIADLRGTV